jgi:hypothetical protein
VTGAAGMMAIASLGFRLHRVKGRRRGYKMTHVSKRKEVSILVLIFSKVFSKD